jgi:predicted DNA-binding transcriptional regulator YafY
VLGRLRDSGLAPLAESFEGVIHVTAPAGRRGEPPRRRTSRDLADAHVDLTADEVRDVVAAIRAGDQIAGERPERLTPAPAETIGVLGTAAESNVRTWISYVDHNGMASERIVEPVRVADGWLTAYEDDADQPRTFALHRIAAARIIEEDTENE